jgi:transposase
MRVDLAYTTEIPERPRPQVTQYRVWVCRCTVCGHQVRGHHPDRASDQYGATAHRLGPRVMAAAHVLHYGVGSPQEALALWHAHHDGTVTDCKIEAEAL